MKSSVSLFLALLSTSAFAEEAPKLYQSIGADFHAQVIVVPSQQANHYLLQFKGFEHDIDGQTRLYVKTWNSTNIEDGYHYRLAGSTKVNFRNNTKYTLQNGNHIPTFQVYLSEKSMTNMVYSGTADISSPQKLLTKYQARQGLTESKIAAKKQIQQAKSKFTTTCSTSLNIDIDWVNFENISAKTTPGMLSNYLHSLAQLCEIDKDYQAEIQSIDKLVVTPSSRLDENSVSRDGNKLVISLAKNAPNVSETSYTALIDVL